jgi:hypothetical protein
MKKVKQVSFHDDGENVVMLIDFCDGSSRKLVEPKTGPIGRSLASQLAILAECESSPRGAP